MGSHPLSEGDDSLSSSGLEKEQQPHIVTAKLHSLEIEAITASESEPRQPLPGSRLQRWAGNRTRRRSSRRDWPPEPRWVAVGRYVSLSTLAAVLAIICPGETKLWWRGGPRPNQYSRPPAGRSSSSSSSSSSSASSSSAAMLNWWCLLELITVYLLTMISFFALQGSDPGYLSHDVLADLAKRDERFLLDAVVEEDEDEVEIEVEKNMESRRDTSSTTERDYHPIGDGPTHGDSSKEADDLRYLNGDRSKSFNNMEGGYYNRTRRRVCEKCHFAPPLRAHHCRICDKCVATFDHHCEFVGTCIGERNHCRFWWFLLAQMLALHACVSIVSTSQLGLISLSRHDYMYLSVWVVASELYLYGLFLPAVLVWAIHTVLALTNSTTFECGMGAARLEYLRGTRPTDLPFSSRHCRNNLRIFCCQRDAACEDNCLPLPVRHGDGGGGTRDDSGGRRQPWVPIGWRPPGRIIRDSEDWWEHPWQNKYWSCC